MSALGASLCYKVWSDFTGSFGYHAAPGFFGFLEKPPAC